MRTLLLQTAFMLGAALLVHFIEHSAGQSNGLPLIRCGIAAGLWLNYFISATWFFFDAWRSGAVITRFELFGIKIINKTKLGATVPAPFWINSHYDPPDPEKDARQFAKGNAGNTLCLVVGILGMGYITQNSLTKAHPFILGIFSLLAFQSVIAWIAVRTSAVSPSYGKLITAASQRSRGFIELCNVAPLEARRMVIRPRDYPDDLIAAYERAAGRPIRLWVESIRDLDRGDDAGASDKLQAAYIQLRGTDYESSLHELILSSYATEVCAPRKDWATFDEATAGLKDDDPLSYMQGVVRATREYTWGDRQAGLELARKSFKKRMFSFERGNPHRDFQVNMMKKRFPELAEEFERMR